jgi:hypothetical protein
MLVQRCSAHAFNRFAGNFAAFSQSDDDDLDDDDEIFADAANMAKVG